MVGRPQFGGTLGKTWRAPGTPSNFCDIHRHGGRKHPDVKNCEPCHQAKLKYQNWYTANHLEETRLYGVRGARKSRLKAIKRLGGKCVGCGITDWRVLQINHKNGGGAKELRGMLYRRFEKSIIDGTRPIDDLDLRCANCNILYEYERGFRKTIDLSDITW